MTVKQQPAELPDSDIDVLKRHPETWTNHCVVLDLQSELGRARAG